MIAVLKPQEESQKMGVSFFRLLFFISVCQTLSHNWLSWLNTVLAVCEYMSLTKSWQEKIAAHELKLGK